MRLFRILQLILCSVMLYSICIGEGVSSPIASCTTATNPYCNPNSQRVADYVATYLYDPEVQMLRTAYQPGCIDSNSAPKGPQVTTPCEATFWTTSDNNPTCATLADFGYSQMSSACIGKIFNVLKFTTSGPQPPQETGAWQSGWRYEAYYGIPIPVGSPANQHFAVQVGELTQTGYGCQTPPCTYAIKADTNTGSVGLPNIRGPVDIVAPQAINYWLRGNKSSARSYADNLIARWNGHGIPQQINYPPYCYTGYNCYSVWELGQVMFVMRVLGLDTSTKLISTAAGKKSYAQIFKDMTNQLWKIQNSDGSMPNEYHDDNIGFFGFDAENQDGALLPFSYSVVQRIQNAFGCQPSNTCPQPFTPTISAFSMINEAASIPEPDSRDPADSEHFRPLVIRSQAALA